MSIFSPSRHRLALAVLTVVVIAGLGTFGAIRVDASSPAHAAPTIVPEVDVAAGLVIIDPPPGLLDPAQAD